MSRSTYNYHRQHAKRVDPERERLKAKVIELHEASRNAAGSRTLSAQLKQQGESVGRYKTRRFLKKQGYKASNLVHIVIKLQIKHRVLQKII